MTANGVRLVIHAARVLDAAAAPRKWREMCYKTSIVGAELTRVTNHTSAGGRSAYRQGRD